MRKVYFMILFILIGCLVLTTAPISVMACDCVKSPTVEAALENSSAVFSGKVVKVKQKRNQQGFTNNIVHLEVHNSWKGVNQSQIIITTGTSSGDCGFIFTEGKEYLVYTSDSTLYGAKTPEVTICNRTNPLGSSQADLEILGKGKAPDEQVDLTREFNRNSHNEQIVISTIFIVAAGSILYFIKKRKRTIL